MKLLLVGASGLVGKQVLQIALEDERVTSVIAPSRRLLLEHPKLQAPVVDFERLVLDAPWWQADAVICTLGTTMKKAQSPEAFKHVDYDYPLMIARLAKEKGTETFVLNSAIGANANSRFFYNRVKGELERDLRNFDFASLTYVRPGVIVGKRSESRKKEWVLIQLLRIFGPVLPRHRRLNPARQIAKALLDSALQQKPGLHVVASAEMT